MDKFSNRVFGLDVVRAAAILLVVFSHCTYILPEFNSQLTDAIRLLGATGVDIFFVLSGYLIGGLLLRNLKRHKTTFSDLIYFWKRRWLRTLPNYFVVLLCNIGLILFLKSSLIYNVWHYVLFLQNFKKPHPDFFTEAWSLSIEEYAYVLLPLIIYTTISFFKKMRAIKVFLFTTIAVIGLLFLFKIQFYFTGELETYKDWSSKFRKVTVYRLDAIYYGFIMVYLVSNHAFFLKHRLPLFVLGVVMFIGLNLSIVSFNVIPNTHVFFYSICYLPLISISIALAFPWFIELQAKRIFKSIVVYISKRSYAIYLVNYSIVLLTLRHFFQPSLTLTILYLTLTLILSEVLYKLVELPFLKLRERIVPR